MPEVSRGIAAFGRVFSRGIPVRLTARLGALALLALLAACAGPSLEEGLATEFRDQGLAEVRNSGFEEAYVLPGADLPAYGQVQVTALDLSSMEVTQTAVSGTTRNQWQVTPDSEAALQDAWSAATGRAFSDYPRGDGALRLDAALTRVAPGRGTASATGAAGAPVYGTSDVVNVSAEFRVYDGASDQLLAVIRDRRAIASLPWGRAASADTVNLFNRWAALLHTRISGR